MLRPLHLLTWAALLLGGLGLAGCADSHDAALGDLADLLEQFNERLATVDTREDAQAALPRLLGLADRIVAAEQRLNTLDERQSAAKSPELEPYLERMSAAYDKLMEHQRRLEQARALEPIEPALARMGLAPEEAAAAAR